MAQKKRKQLYLAYGSNLSLTQMSLRCPNAVVIGTSLLKDYRLLFRGKSGNTHATIEKAQGYFVPVLVWELTPSDEVSLDMYEGFPQYYRKEYFTVHIGKTEKSALIYIMTEGKPLGIPSSYYYNIIKNGYISSNFDIEVLETALSESSR